MLLAYASILIFLIIATLFAGGTLLAAFLVRPRVKDTLKRTAYECGMEAVGLTTVQTNIRFYTYALLFVIFDVEALYLFPWAVVVRSMGAVALVEMAIFLGVLTAGLAYAWKMGALQWE
ncbi:MAG: NADH-quinone oxidoreductase subunit A [Elusimicrobia bacterium]|nr:NADH-quinone oxidoreductase subunit A [Elusimicrobiota bacterium]